MSILFIRGFNTDMKSTFDENKHRYSNFDNFFEMSTYKLHYFNYSPDQDLEDVYLRLTTTLLNGSYNILMGHSMGGGLLLQFLTDNKDQIHKYDKILFLMPAIMKIFPYNSLFEIPFVENLYLPKGLVFPKQSLFNNGNPLNDEFNLISIKQNIAMYNNYIPKMDLSILDQKNCFTVLANDDEYIKFDTYTLDGIHNKIALEGKHEMFNELNHSHNFFKTIKSLL